jgi:hypothetical protein
MKSRSVFEVYTVVVVVCLYSKYRYARNAMSWPSDK